ncbi:hypothetical protein RUM44_008969 [Polyplax serrata]|uniref:Mitogen-activated protein kinase kinase kinase n=1 Tax=Polyplax serrata TaxID=468196 RepID=A0ABR1ARZ7_POLSC
MTTSIQDELLFGAQLFVQSGSTGSRESSDTGAKSLGFHLFIESQLQPIPPDRTSEESIKIYEEHKEMAREYLEIQTEMAYLSRYLKKLEDKLNSTEQQRQQIQQLVNEKESLEQLQQNLTKQLELLQRQRQNDWTYVNSQDS